MAVFVNGDACGAEEGGVRRSEEEGREGGLTAKPIKLRFAENLRVHGVRGI